MANFDPIQAYAFVRQQGEEGRQRGEEQRVRGLQAQAYNAPQAQRSAIYGQIAQTSPDAALKTEQALQERSDAGLRRLRGAVNFIDQARAQSKQTGDMRFVNAALQQVSPFISEVLGKPGPTEWTPDMEPGWEGLKAQIAMAESGNPASELPSDIRSLQILQGNPELLKLDRERRQAAGMVPKLAETSQGYGWATPGGGIQLAPVTGVAGQGAPQGGFSGDPAQSAQAFYQRMRSAGLDDTAASAATEAYLSDLGYREGPAPAQSVGSPIAQPYQAPQRTAPPAGYRESAAGGLEFIPGGPADPAIKPTPAAKPMPPNIFKQREATLAEAETAEGINQSLDKHLQRMQRGELSFGPLANQLAEARNFAGMSDPASRNFAEFRSDLEKLRNDSLRLNAGVQTDGDAQRAWNELFANLNDTEYVKQRLATIRQLNERAEMLKRASVERIDQEYGGVGDGASASGDDDEALIGKYL